MRKHSFTSSITIVTVDGHCIPIAVNKVITGIIENTNHKGTEIRAIKATFLLGKLLITCLTGNELK